MLQFDNAIFYGFHYFLFAKKFIAKQHLPSTLPVIPLALSCDDL